MLLLEQSSDVCITIVAEKWNHYLQCTQYRLLFQGYCTTEEWSSGSWIETHKDVLQALRDPFRPYETEHPFSYKQPCIPYDMVISINGTRMEWRHWYEKMELL